MATCNDSNHSSSSSSSGSSIGQQLPTTPSEGLTYALNADGVSYSVTGVGTCTDAMVVIPSTYSELPVTAIAKKSV
ncbi:MAG: hypothetical protein IJV80_06605 [Clostridia bacterium]|nr:hypothetical protein [Clostridia bacterium]